MNEAVSKSLFQPDVLVDPFDFYEEKRAETPVFFDEASGAYVVLDYDLISEAVGRLDDFSNTFNALLSGGKSEPPTSRSTPASASWSTSPSPCPR